MLDATPVKYNEEPLPFPFSNRHFCLYEPIEKKIVHARVLIVNDLLRYESDLSDLAREEWNGSTESRLRFEVRVSKMACNNIAQNIIRLVKNPKILTVHLSEIGEAAESFRPDAIVMSGTFTDFDYYNQEHIAKATSFLKSTKIPVLAICGAHQLVGTCFGAPLKTLDNFAPEEKREGRFIEYQYRFIKITDKTDPIFEGNDDQNSGIWQDYTKEDDILRVWQNHGLKVEGVPEGFKLLATSYLCKNQMMVKNSDGQLIYAVQFHLEKSFQDFNSENTQQEPAEKEEQEDKKRLLRDEASKRSRWTHLSESRDGRILFENFLKLALEHNKSANR